MNITRHPATPPDTSPEALARQTWKPLTLFNLYRLTLASLFFVVSLPEFWVSPLGERDHDLFLIISSGYLLFALLGVVTISNRRPAFKLQLHSQLLADIMALTLLMHASGGVKSGVGTLMIASLFGGGMLMGGRMAVMYAALATLSLLGVESYDWISGGPRAPNFTHAGLLGATYFVTAMLAHALAQRARESETLAAQRGVDLANMQQLTEYVIQRMQTGIVVIDPAQRIRLINESGWRLLGLSASPAGQRLTDAAPELAAQLERWHNDPQQESHIFRPSGTGPEIVPRFAQLGHQPQRNAAGTLIFLEDTAATAQQAQQMKLASLGRLTASIAHEIRNPLGAISHAGQLLAESPHLPAGDNRLIDIIRDNSRRMNIIVENVLQLSRRRRAQPEDIMLKSWLEHFVTEFCATHDIAPAHITVDISPANAAARIDPSQLHQILWNLCHNGARYSRAATGSPRLLLRGGHTSESPAPFLDVIDSGPGVADEHLEHIFEPFFTTEAKGTGLGLYLCRELCEANQARLSYIPGTGGGRFRITFADPRRKQVI